MPNNKKGKSKLHEDEEVSVGTAQMRKKTGNKFSQMMTRSKKSNEEQEQAGSRRNSREQTPVVEKDQETLPTNLSQSSVDMVRRKSNESLTSDVTMVRRKSNESLMSDVTMGQRKSNKSLSSDINVAQRKSKELTYMELDNDYFDNNLSGPTKTTPRGPASATNLTKEEFDYTMGLFDAKITSLYKLCKFIGNKQQENSKALRRLVALDELSDDFWNVSNLIHLAVLF